MTPKHAPVAARFADVAPPFLVLLLLLLHGFLYNQVGQIAGSRGVNFGPRLELPLDASVPLVAAFALPYMFVWFLPAILIGYAIFVAGAKPVGFRPVYLSLAALMFMCYALWIAFPVRVDLRMEAASLEDAGWTGRLVEFNYRNASVWNACPSFHVAGPWFLYRTIRVVAGRLPVTFLWMVLSIVASTVLIRIHFLLDIAGGFLVSEFVIRTVFRPIWNRNALKSDQTLFRH